MVEEEDELRQERRKEMLIEIKGKKEKIKKIKRREFNEKKY